MSLEIKIAETEEEKHACYKIRYEAYKDIGYVKEDEVPSKELVDEYDKYSTIFIALKDNKGVGTIRITKDSELGFQMEDIFDLTDLRKKCKKLYESSKIMALPGQRYKITLGLVNVLYTYMKKNGITDLCFMAHPNHAKMYEKVGIYPFAETKIHPEINQPAVPLHWDLKNTKELYKTIFEKAENIRL